MLTKERFNEIMLEEGFESQEFRDTIWNSSYNPFTMQDRFKLAHDLMLTKFPPAKQEEIEEISLRQTCEVFRTNPAIQAEYKRQYGHTISLKTKTNEDWPDEVGDLV